MKDRITKTPAKYFNSKRPFEILYPFCAKHKAYSRTFVKPIKQVITAGAFAGFVY